LSGLYVAQSSPGSKCQSVSPNQVGTLPLSYAGSPFEKRRVRIVAHDSLEATDNPRICLRIDAYCVAATIFKYHESVIFSISRIGDLCRQRSSWACPNGEVCSEKYGGYGQERRPQCSERHKKSCAHCG